jgi:hypothetical protein
MNHLYVKENLESLDLVNDMLDICFRVRNIPSISIPYAYKSATSSA